MSIAVRWGNRSGMVKFARLVDAIGNGQLVHASNRAVNWTGDRTRTRVRRALTKQTGLKAGTIRKAIKTRRSSWGTLTYTMSSFGGDISLKYFGARETRKGVSAAPFGKRQIFPGTFIKGGRFPKRVALNKGSHVFKRVGSGRLPIEKQLSGVIIPREMVRDQSADAFDKSAVQLEARFAHEIGAIASGAAPRGRKLLRFR